MHEIQLTFYYLVEATNKIAQNTRRFYRFISIPWSRFNVDYFTEQRKHTRNPSHQNPTSKWRKIFCLLLHVISFECLEMCWRYPFEERLFLMVCWRWVCWRSWVFWRCSWDALVQNIALAHVLLSVDLLEVDIMSDTLRLSTHSLLCWYISIWRKILRSQPGRQFGVWKISQSVSQSISQAV